ncbi:glycosyltransferase WbuB [Pseudoxanthomonas suwonensis]|uniref:glycosyltransferase WbuB n=1 Tax=Pseudoxanthomonas suwonensis TaxID=314722 RepID=UPI00138EFF37|nr:glycosyltransferase WbuB [Pseudoxanthomonas suwonensis]KAF1700355.1 colanic acid biosynthesis glycosyltransferase WcaI [Pseudoxanthomonas suwonensis]
MSVPSDSPRILVVGINYAPENIGTGKYTSEMCEWLTARGRAVRVVTAPPYYPAWMVWDGYRPLWYRRERISEVDVIRCPLWVPTKPSGITRILHLASFGLSSSLALLWSIGWRPTHVVSIAPTLANAPMAALVARLSGARSWLHIQDFELDAALDMGIVEAGPMKRLAMGLERLLLRSFDRVSTISPKMVERLGKKGVAPARRVLFPNWADIDAIQPLSRPSTYRQELGIPDDAVVALYSGNMGLKQGLELLGEAALRLRDEERLYFVFGGQGPGRDALEVQCAGLPNVRFLGLQPTERLKDWLGLADIHLLPQRADVADLVMPSKLTGMLASGRPTLATALPGTGVALALERSGRVVPPGDVEAFTSALRELAADPSVRKSLGDAARNQALSTLSRESILNRFEQALLAP